MRPAWWDHEYPHDFDYDHFREDVSEDEWHALGTAALHLNDGIEVRVGLGREVGTVTVDVTNLLSFF